MTPLNLIEKLTEKLREAVKDFKMVAQEQPPKNVTVYIQNLPDVNEDSYYPFVVVELVGVTDEAGGSLASVLITCGIFGESADAFKDLLNLSERVRQCILKNRLVGAAALQLPLEFAPVEKTSVSFQFANFFVQYGIVQPVPSGFFS